jgi:hypothetical protein
VIYWYLEVQPVAQTVLNLRECDPILVRQIKSAAFLSNMTIKNWLEAAAKAKLHTDSHLLTEALIPLQVG